MVKCYFAARTSLNRIGSKSQHAKVVPIVVVHIGNAPMRNVHKTKRLISMKNFSFHF